MCLLCIIGLLHELEARAVTARILDTDIGDGLQYLP